MFLAIGMSSFEPPYGDFPDHLLYGDFQLSGLIPADVLHGETVPLDNIPLSSPPFRVGEALRNCGNYIDY